MRSRGHEAIVSSDCESMRSRGHEAIVSSDCEAMRSRGPMASGELREIRIAGAGLAEPPGGSKAASGLPNPSTNL
jgi:hypothetical protein